MSWLNSRLMADDFLTCKEIYERLGFRFVVGAAINGTTAIAGPLCVASVILPLGHNLQLKPPLTQADMKKIYVEIKEQCVNLQFGWAAPMVMIRAGKEQALEAAVRVSLGHVNRNNPASVVLMEDCGQEFVLRGLEESQTPLLAHKGLAEKVEPVIAASISARMAREYTMLYYCHKLFPQYGWDTNYGYATKKHLQSILNYGITPLHRDLSNIKTLQGKRLFANFGSKM